MWYNYILQSLKDKKLYTGVTSNLRNRFTEHNSGEVASTKYRRPLKLLYYEACLDEEDAKRREKTLKSGKGKRYIAMRLKKYLSEPRTSFVKFRGEVRDEKRNQ